MKCLELKTTMPTEEEINEMEFWMRTGCVYDYYLKNAFGNQREDIRLMPEQYVD